MSKSRLKLANDLVSAVDSGSCAQALAIARLNAPEPRKLDVFSYNSSGVLIDCGSALRDISAIHLGMEIAEEFVLSDKVSKDITIQSRYNLSNGYAALALECERDGDLDRRRQHWEAQRDQLQLLVLEPSTIPEELRTEVYTNFGNVLDELGRTNCVALNRAGIFIIEFADAPECIRERPFPAGLEST